MNTLQYFDWGFNGGDFILRGGEIVQPSEISIMGATNSSIFDNVDCNFSRSISCENTLWQHFAAKMDRVFFQNKKQTLKLDSGLNFVRLENFDEGCRCVVGSTDFKYIVLSQKNTINSISEIDSSDVVIHIENPFDFSLKTNFGREGWCVFLIGAIAFTNISSSPSCISPSSNLIFPPLPLT